jgi:steroid delta-isomerase-like uncharacterized protein
MTEAKMSQTDRTIDDFARRWAQAWNDHDPDAVAALCHPEIEWDDPAARRVLRGRPEVRDWVSKSLDAFPDAAFEMLAIYTDAGGSGAALRWRMQARFLGPLDPPGFAPTGRPVRVDGVDLCRFDDGLLRSLQMIYDGNAVAVQAGLVPAPGSRAERLMVAGQRLAAGVRARIRR